MDNRYNYSKFKHTQCLKSKQHIKNELIIIPSRNKPLKSQHSYIKAKQDE